MSLEMVLAILRRIRESGVDLAALLSYLQVATDPTASLGERIRAAVSAAEILAMLTPTAVDDEIVGAALALVNSDFFPRLLDLVDRLLSGDEPTFGSEPAATEELAAIDWVTVLAVAKLIVQLLQAWREE